MRHPGFDDLAATWDDDPAKRERATTVARAIVDRIDLQGAHVVEDGCGTGLLGFALFEVALLGTMTFVDPSDGMREVVARKIAALAPRRACVLSPYDDIGGGHDLVTSLMVLHHAPDPAAKIAEWGRWIEPGGHLAFADLYPEDGSFHGPQVEDVHRGFDPAQVEGWMRESGVEPLGASRVFSVREEVDGVAREFPVWLAWGRRS